MFDFLAVPFSKQNWFQTTRRNYSRGEGAGLERNLLMVLHGFGGRKEPFATLPQKFSLSTTAFLIFNAPEAPCKQTNFQPTSGENKSKGPFR